MLTNGFVSLTFNLNIFCGQGPKLVPNMERRKTMFLDDNDRNATLVMIYISQRLFSQ